MIDHYPNVPSRFKNEHNQITTDWGEPYPPLGYEGRQLDVSTIPSSWDNVPHSLWAPPTIGYPRFVPELQDLISKGIVEVRFKGTKHQYRLKELTLFD
jgi:hypothetical protein